jgi:hypothetical protein
MVTVKRTVTKWLLYAAGGYALLLLQLTAVNRLGILGVTPYLPPLLLGCMLTFERGPAASVYALLLGTWCDTYTHGVLLYTLLYPALALWAIRAAAVFAEPAFLTALLWSALAALSGQFLYFCFFLFLPGHAGITALWPVLPAELLYSLCVLPFVYAVFWRVNRR